MKEFLLREIRLALEFHQKTVKTVLRLIGFALRYAFWILPWMLLLLFSVNPFLSVWKQAMKGEGIPSSSASPDRLRIPPEPGPSGNTKWEDLQRRLDTGVRTWDRILYRIRRR